VGAHSLQASYSGDSNNAANKSALVTETVNPAAAATTTTTLAVAPASSSAGQSVVLTATVTPVAATGTVAFKDGQTTLGAAPLTNGTASFSISTLAAGSHTLVASYGGDGNYPASVSSSVFETVGPAPACAAFPVGFVPFSSAANVSQPNAAGDLVVVGAMSTTNFSTYQGLPLPVGPNQQFCGTVVLAPGIAVTAYVPTATERTGNFSPFAGLLVDPQAGGTPFPGGIIPVSRIPGTFAWRIVALLQTSTTTLSATPNPSAPAQSVTLTATVTPSSATGTVTFLEGSTTLGTGALSAGTATFTTSTLATGSHVLTASYGGDARNGAGTSNPVTETVGLSTTTTTLSVTPASSTSGQTVTLTATVSPASATGSVTFQDGSTILGTTALNAGTAAFTTSTLATGSHLLTASYGGDAKNGAGTSNPVTETVGVSTTTTTLSVTPASSTFGQAVTLTATVTPPSASGSVTFQDGSAIVGTVAVSAGTATSTTSTLATGSHLLTASYSGDFKNGASTSNPVTETVSKQTSTIVLSVSSTSSSPGQAVTLTATVTPSSATGSIAFLDSQTVLGTVTLAGGTAVFTTSTLGAGKHALSASYSGDSRNGAGISNSFVETVASGSPLQIASPTTPVATFVSVAWSQTFKATGGTPPYQWTLPSNTLPDLALTSSGDTAVVSGTPTTAGNYQLTVRVQDSVSQSTQAPLTLTVNPLPVITITAPQPATPADQPAPQLSLAQPYPFALTGTLTLAFAPNAPGLPVGYNPVQFSSGGTTFPIAIPANATTPNPPIPSIQLGSVAGDIIGTLGPLMLTGTAQILPVPGQPPSVKITVPAMAPIVVPGSVKIANVTAAGFQVFLDASSTTRDLSSGAFVFTAAPGTQMNGCTPSCTVSFATEAAAWFASTAGVSNGGTTSLTVPFAFSGDPSVIGTVAVTLTNSVGKSATVSGGR
jgi:hypothetical protein